MKKALVITMMAALLLCVSVAVMADATNWILSIKPTDSANANSAGTLRLGWKAGYTDGIDTALSEKVTPPAPAPGGKNAAAVSQMIDGTWSMNDYRASLATSPALPKVWNVSLFTQGAWTDSAIKVTITPSTTSPFPYGPDLFLEIKYNDAAAGWTTKVFDSASQLATAGFTFNVANKQAAGEATDIIVTVRNGGTVITPEPSSMVALASGLFGLVGFGIRRRK